MSSRAGSASRPGFSILEVLVSITILAIMAAFTAPNGIAFYQNQQLDTLADRTVQYLRTASVRALSEIGDSNHGVNVTSSTVTLYRGATYAARVTAYDEPTTYPSNITATGLTGVNFAKGTGAPSVTGTITLTNGTRTYVITVYSTGAISRN